MKGSIQLKGITWDHSRGFTSVVATGQRFHELHPDVDIHWQKRSLQEFADKPLADLAEDYDLLVIDHPWAGFASASGILADLNGLMPVDFLADQAANSVGHSYASYQFNDRQWALAIDAATPVSAYRPDILERAGATLPATYDELIALAEKGLVCCPSIPLDVYGNFLNLLTAAGEAIFPSEEEVVQREAGVFALERLRKFMSLIPEKFFDINPIGALEIMSQSDEFAYCPYTYGYANYSRPGYAKHLLKFGDVIGMTADKPGMTMLGGTGLALSAHCKHLAVAAAYAQFTASTEVQQGIFFDAGGQPGHRAAWLNPKLNAVCSDFFTDTLPTLDRAFVRPRYAGYLDFQDQAGEPIHAYLRKGGDAGAVLDALNKLYRETRK